MMIVYCIGGIAVRKETAAGAVIKRYREHLLQEECAAATVEKYLRVAEEFCRWLGGRGVSKRTAVAWKEEQLATGLAPVTINAKLCALNSLLRFLKRPECRVKLLRLQRRVFRTHERSLTREEYLRLLETARERGKGRLELLMEAICSTGIRVSEAKYLTVEAARDGQAVVCLKGKVRTILLPQKLCRKLLKFARRQKTASGEIFLTKSGNSLSRKQIWREMKALCAEAGVAPSKVFPHNLRHLFAVSFYRACRDIVKLADVLGHSSIETTRIYLLTTSMEHARYLDRLRLVC